ncbi:tetratricopeptide repeat protein [Streptomyces himalayensis]|uniref:Tetratricopeptide repeat protein n=1 Tax=Streptomyces himalayensis subsp. himalayensis TaxID=2756131 RepID=A0A7W0DQ95_9ACTN|nr:tetratricopeptide repeat protein [Streptomyces himalayensis]MBA2949282.1 tetratricopeptide repeat protein [Streptomyces himalayensis subsp. himalayensis]
MADFHIGSQRADLIQNADTIINGGPLVDHRAAAAAALEARDYETAIGHLKRVLEREPGDGAARFQLVLAALRGRHPDRYGTRQIQGLTERLVRLVTDEPDCHHAKVLALIINDGLLTRGSGRPSPPTADTRRLVSLVDPERGREILDHVPVPESRTRGLLDRRLRRVTPRSTSREN